MPTVVPNLVELFVYCISIYFAHFTMSYSQHLFYYSLHLNVTYTTLAYRSIKDLENSCFKPIVAAWSPCLHEGERKQQLLSFRYFTTFCLVRKKSLLEQKGSKVSKY